MATASDITTTPTSGLNHIDALLDKGPDWNYLTNSAGNPITTLTYTFSISSGNESGQTGQEAFTSAQQIAARAAFAYISQLTGIQFAEVVDGSSAQFHLCNVDLQGANVTGLCSWRSTYGYNASNKFTYDADAYVYLDNVEWFGQNRNLTAGTYGYETLLHELGHALGLKHPFDDSIHLPSSQDNTSNTLMSYTNVGGAHATFSPYDIAALNWLYGGDGLGGALGINSTTGARYLTGTNGADTLTGTAANDKLEGDGGNDMIDGGNGFDTAVFGGVRSNYALSALSNGDLTVTSLNGTDGTDTLHSIELLQFSDMSVRSADIGAAQFTFGVTTNAHGYTGYPYTNLPQVTGKADVGTTVMIYSAATNALVGTATPNQYGYYTAQLSKFADGPNQVYATEVNAAGQVLATSARVDFKVDTTPPVAPTFTLDYKTGSNQANMSGTGEAGTTISVVRTSDLQTITHTSVQSDGTWQLETSPLPNGSYTVRVSSIDFGDNAANAKTSSSWSVNSAANITGTAGNDMLKPVLGVNNAVDGGNGLDTAVYAGSRAGFTVQQADWGFDIFENGVSAANGHDSLINVERIQFNDGAIAIDNTSAQLFRLYSAAFGRTSDAGGMGYWIDRMDNGSSIQVVSREFMVGGDGKGQPEFTKMYGANPTDTQFVTQLYSNVLGRTPDGGGFDYWMGVLNNTSEENKLAVRAQLLIEFASSDENVAKVVGQLEHGVDYIPLLHA